MPWAWLAFARVAAVYEKGTRNRLARMMTPQQQRRAVTVLAVILGIAMVLSLVGPFLSR